MKIQGTIKGNTIELKQKLPLPDGASISCEISDDLTQKKPNWEELELIIGAWKNEQEIDEIFTEIDRDRHKNLGDEINLDV